MQPSPRTLMISFGAPQSEIRHAILEAQGVEASSEVSKSHNRRCQSRRTGAGCSMVGYQMTFFRTNFSPSRVHRNGNALSTFGHNSLPRGFNIECLEQLDSGQRHQQRLPHQEAAKRSLDAWLARPV
jgi:hypothetical protein